MGGAGTGTATRKAACLSFHRVLVVAGAALLAVQCLKFAGVLSAIRWIVANGEKFGAALREREDDFSETVYWQLLDDARGGRSCRSACWNIDC